MLCYLTLTHLKPKVEDCTLIADTAVADRVGVRDRVKAAHPRLARAFSMLERDSGQVDQSDLSNLQRVSTFVLCRAVPCGAVRCCAVLCCAVLRCAALCCAVPCRAVPFCAVLCCALPCHVTLCRRQTDL